MILTHKQLFENLLFYKQLFSTAIFKPNNNKNFEKKIRQTEKKCQKQCAKWWLNIVIRNTLFLLQEQFWTASEEDIPHGGWNQSWTESI